MAWLVIVCGFLLAVGGGVSLLFGFDIVVTERGSAMTIGGVIALSGGIIAMGIGSALLKLKAILRALEARAGRAPRAPASDRPVVPLQADVPPPPPRAADVAMGAAAGIAVAGLAAGAAGRAARPVEREPETMPEPDPAMIAPEPVSMTDIEAMERPQAADTAQIERRPAPPDLEAELSRALAEVDDPPRPRRSFADGLQELLDRAPMPAERRADQEAEEPLLPLAPSAMAQSEPAAQATISDDHGERQASAMDEETIVLSDRGRWEYASVEPDQQPDVLAPEVPAPEVPAPEVVASQATEPEDIAAEAVAPEVLASQDLAPERFAPDISAPDARMPADRMAASPALQTQVLAAPQEVAAAADGYAGATAAFAGDGGQTAEPTHPAPSRPAPQPAPRQQAVLGSYSIGGRTYRMFADGSVEAETESGVQRFTSMDELRRHLAGG